MEEPPPLRSISMKAISAQIVSLAFMPLHARHVVMVGVTCARGEAGWQTPASWRGFEDDKSSALQGPPQLVLSMKVASAQIMSLTCMLLHANLTDMLLFMSAELTKP